MFFDWPGFIMKGQLIVEILLIFFINRETKRAFVVGGKTGRVSLHQFCTGNHVFDVKPSLVVLYVKFE